MLLRGLSRYVWVALVATSVSTAVFAHLYREALKDVARVEAEARADALAAANERWALNYGEAAAAYEARIRQLEERRAAADAAVTESLSREREATARLEAYIDSMEETEWSVTPLPSDVVARLRELVQ